jgi:hypothetical protein
VRKREEDRGTLARAASPSRRPKPLLFTGAEAATARAALLSRASRTRLCAAGAGRALQAVPVGATLRLGIRSRRSAGRTEPPAFAFCAWERKQIGEEDKEGGEAE